MRVGNWSIEVMKRHEAQVGLGKVTTWGVWEFAAGLAWQGRVTRTEAMRWTGKAGGLAFVVFLFVYPSFWHIKHDHVHVRDHNRQDRSHLRTPCFGFTCLLTRLANLISDVVNACEEMWKGNVLVSLLSLIFLFIASYFIDQKCLV